MLREPDFSGAWFADGVNNDGIDSVVTDSWPLEDAEKWMNSRGDYQVNPYQDPDANAWCDKHGQFMHESDACGDCNAQAKWGWEENHTTLESAKMARTIGGYGFDVDQELSLILTENDGVILLDGDKVRDPESGEIHPTFLSILAILGPTYVSVSSSGTGVHAFFHGEIPQNGNINLHIDDESWGGNGETPVIEVYANKRAAIETGERLTWSRENVQECDEEVFTAILEADDVDVTSTNNTEHSGSEYDDEFGVKGDYSDEVEVDIEEVVNQAGEHTVPQSVILDDRNVTHDIEDCFDAVTELDCRAVAERTIVQEWTSPRAGNFRSFLPTWGSSSDGGTANFVGEHCWKDSGSDPSGNAGVGGPIEMAAIDLGMLSHTNAKIGCVNGRDYWACYEHLRDNLGFDLPVYVEPSFFDGISNYQNTVEGDVNADPDACLFACVAAREDGVVGEDQDPPEPALVAVARWINDSDSLDASDVTGDTRALALDVFHDMTVKDVRDEFDVPAPRDSEREVTEVTG